MRSCQVRGGALTGEGGNLLPSGGGSGVACTIRKIEGDLVTCTFWYTMLALYGRQARHGADRVLQRGCCSTV